MAMSNADRKHNENCWVCGIPLSENDRTLCSKCSLAERKSMEIHTIKPEVTFTAKECISVIDDVSEYYRVKLSFYKTTTYILVGIITAYLVISLF